jgi:hypothetical protein
MLSTSDGESFPELRSLPSPRRLPEAISRETIPKRNREPLAAGRKRQKISSLRQIFCHNQEQL